MLVNLLVHQMDENDMRLVIPYLVEDIYDASEMTDDEVVELLNSLAVEKDN